MRAPPVEHPDFPSATRVARGTSIPGSHSRERPKRAIPESWASGCFPSASRSAQGRTAPAWGRGPGGRLGTEAVTPGALCPHVRYVAHGILNKAYRKVLEQLSARKYLQTLVVKGPG